MVHPSGRDLFIPVMCAILIGVSGCYGSENAPLFGSDVATYYKSSGIESKSSCGSGKVEVCHNGNTLCISVNALPAHEAHGDNACACENVATLYIDQDGDFYGDPDVPAAVCSGTEGYAGDPGDCDDTDAAVRPGAVEACDGRDDDCDGVVPEDEGDADGDGYGLCAADCDDEDGQSYPGAREVCDAIDQDCDGLADVQDAATDEWLRSVCAAVLSPTAGTFDARGVDQPTVLFNEDLGMYQMWYRAMDSSNVGRIAYATSENGAVWTKVGAVLEPGATGSWEGVKLGFPAVTYRDGLYRMWYQGQDQQNVIRIGYAESADGVSWTKYANNPVLDVGPAGSWDSRVVHAPSVIYDEDEGVFHMWYSGGDGTTLQTGYASSPDGLTWTKAAEPVLKVGTAGDWDAKRVVFARVIRLGDTFQLWYSGDDETNSYTYEIGYATATEATAFTREEADPVFSFGPSGAFDAYMVYGGEVIEQDDGFSMYYSGASSSSGPYCIGLARSAGSQAMLAALE